MLAEHVVDVEGWKEFTGSEMVMLRWKEKLRKWKMSFLPEKNSLATTMRGDDWGEREGLQ